MKRLLPPLLLLCFLLGVFALTYPSSFLVFDEVSYAHRAWGLAFGNTDVAFTDALSGARISVVPSDFWYPLGTSYVAACFVLATGASKSVFLLGLSCWVGSYFISRRTLRRLGYPAGTAVLYFTYIPAIVFSRTVMSDMPSMLLSAAFAAVFFRMLHLRDFSARSYLLLGFWAGLSLWFRETNLVLLLPFMVAGAWRGTTNVASFGRAALLLSLGGFVGLLPRFVSSWWVYGNALFMKPTNYSFHLSNLPANVLIYGLLLLLLIPFAMISIMKYRGRAWRVTQFSIATFVGMYCLYDYNGIESSGFVRAVILCGRFLLPIIPLMVIVRAERYQKFLQSKFWLEHRHKSIVTVLIIHPIVSAIILIVAINLYIYTREAEHTPVFQAMNALVPSSKVYKANTNTKTVMLIPNGEALRWISPIFYAPMRRALWQEKCRVVFADASTATSLLLQRCQNPQINNAVRDSTYILIDFYRSNQPDPLNANISSKDTEKGSRNEWLLQSPDRSDVIDRCLQNQTNHLRKYTLQRDTVKGTDAAFLLVFNTLTLQSTIK